MQTREGRIIIAGMFLGALGGGLAIMLMRMRDVRGRQAELEPLSDTLRRVSWPEVVSIAVAGIALARRIGGLIESPE
jgi:hypothetical protein